MEYSFSFLEIPPLETLEQQESVFLTVRESLSPISENYTILAQTSLIEKNNNINEFLSIEDSNDSKDSEAMVVVKQEQINEELYSILSNDSSVIEETNTNRSIDLIIKQENLLPTVKIDKKRKRESSSFPSYYKFTNKQLDFFKKVKLIQSSSELKIIHNNVNKY